jgi:hypothetical protein
LTVESRPVELAATWTLIARSSCAIGPNKGRGDQFEPGDSPARISVALFWGLQRGQLSAEIPRIPPYSLWHCSHLNMAFAYPFGDCHEPL